MEMYWVLVSAILSIAAVHPLMAVCSTVLRITIFEVEATITMPAKRQQRVSMLLSACHCLTLTTSNIMLKRQQLVGVFEFMEMRWVLVCAILSIPAVHPLMAVCITVLRIAIFVVGAAITIPAKRQQLVGPWHSLVFLRRARPKETFAFGRWAGRWAGQ